jgi:predicted DNA-binding protein (MmcQ/YjbR family)
MNIEQVREYTLSLFGVTEDQPFGDDIITFRLEGKIFVCLWLGGGKYDMNVFVKPNDQSQTCLDFGMARKGRTQFKDGEPRLALKLSPERNEELRAQFSAVTPAYHWNKKHWSDVYYEHLDDIQVEEWIKESYQLVASKLPKAIRQKYIL